MSERVKTVVRKMHRAHIIETRVNPIPNNTGCITSVFGADGRTVIDSVCAYIVNGHMHLYVKKADGDVILGFDMLMPAADWLAFCKAVVAAEELGAPGYDHELYGLPDFTMGIKDVTL